MTAQAAALYAAAIVAFEVAAWYTVQVGWRVYGWFVKRSAEMQREAESHGQG
jgi:hypothetical protein